MSTISGQDSVTYPSSTPVSVQVGQQLTMSPSLPIAGSTYTVSPALPSGLTLNPTTGVISGTPTGIIPAANYSITQTAPNGTVTTWVVVIGVVGTTAGTGTATGTANFTLGGTVTGLGSNGLILASGTTTIQTVTVVSGATTFQFATSIPSGSTYAVTVNTQPASHTCSVTSGTGTISANVTNISVICAQLVVATPVFAPTPGNYGTAQANITITSATAGSTIYYTTNGDTPTTASTLYTTGLGHIWFLAGKTLKAIAVKSGSTDSAVATAEYYYLPLKSGQTTQYVAGDDGATQLGVARSYTNNGNGTVTDNATGLLWQRCSRGLSGATCGTGSATQDTWANQATYCSGLTLAGRTWRVPTVNELADLVDYGVSNPSINPAFPATVANGYWSSTTFAPVTTDAWVVYFFSGGVGSSTKAGNGYVRCISGP